MARAFYGIDGSGIVYYATEPVPSDMSPFTEIDRTPFWLEYAAREFGEPVNHGYRCALPFTDAFGEYWWYRSLELVLAEAKRRFGEHPEHWIVSRVPCGVRVPASWRE
ncbi:MAG: hypothetical protein NZ761_00615 [Dehalococcoidia bacterium]|nr:hypothetical protein [Dehalococcoidia bacterium]